MLFIGLVIGALIAGLVVYNCFWASFYRKKRKMMFLNAANGVSNSVMNIVQMGVVAFTESGMLLFNNKTCLKKLRVEELPQSFSDFVQQFIPDKEIMIKLRLYESLLDDEKKPESDEEIIETEKIESVTTRVEIHNRIIQFHFSKPFFPQSTLRGWVVVLEDVTTAARQEMQRRLFVSTVSHELKTPLATINGYSESLIDWGLREKRPDQIFNDVMKINEESQRITAIISNLTFLSQIENNKEKINMTVYKIDKTVEEVCRDYQDEAKKKGIRLYYQSLTRNMPPVFGCQSMMMQMVGNLINNALKYSPRNTGIWVYVQAHENNVSIKVQDQGKGISKQDRDKVFQAFFRVDETGSRAAGGSGLGLAIVKMMTEVQEGSISLVSRTAEEDESMRSEVGSDFYITVPTAETVFRETLTGVREGAEREEVLYRKAKQYMDKVNNDDYDLGFNLAEVKPGDEENLLISHLIFIDDCDIIDEAEPQAMTLEQSAGEIPPEYIEQEEYNEDPVTPEYSYVPSEQEVVQETVPEYVPQAPTEVVPQVISETIPEAMPETAQAVVPEVIPEVAPEVVPEYSAPVEQASAPIPESEELVPLVKLETAKLVPDPPALRKPILSKETIGTQNAEKRKKSRAKTMADKKAGSSGAKASKRDDIEKKESRKKADDTVSVPSMLKRIIAEEGTQETAVKEPKEAKAPQRSMLYEMTSPTVSEKTAEKE
ncbi:MAG: hypothetical protein J5752_05340 [Clostridiales bacterium]|nr:hypothetical protein [Clostridiales bacterium]